MPASSDHIGLLIWRVPGLPVQGWKLSREENDRLSESKVVVAGFSGRPCVLQAEGPVSEEESFGVLDRMSVPEVEPHTNDAPEEHIGRVARTVDQIRKEGLRKVVIARREDVEIDLPVESTFRRLCETYPKAVVYILRLSDESGDRFWMGATPETLLTTDEHAIYTMSLAGTRRPDGPSFTAKEYDEQLAVTERIEGTLLALGVSKVICKGPETTQAGPVEHLITRIESALPPSGDAFDWACALHPTPAVAGLPLDDALKIIRETENFDRDLYAGFIGWMSGGNSRFYVNLRCMQIGRNRVALYAGGGITAHSDPEAEWEETVHKLETLKSVIRTDTSTS